MGGSEGAEKAGDVIVEPVSSCLKGRLRDWRKANIALLPSK